MKGKKKYIVPLLVATVSASGAVVGSVQNVQQPSQVHAEAVANTVKLVSNNVQITKFEKQVTVGGSFSLPTVTVPAIDGVKIKYTVKKGTGSSARVVKEYTHTTTSADDVDGKYVINPGENEKVETTMAGYYNITITVEQEGVLATVAKDLQVYVTSPTASISLPNNSEYVIPAKVATSQTNFYVPMPGLTIDGEKLTDQEVRIAFQTNKFKVTLTNPEGTQYPLTIDENNDYFYVAPEKLTVAGTYDISYYYKDGTTKASLQGVQSFQTVAGFDASQIDLDFSLLSSHPTTGEVGTPVSLSQLKIFDKATGTTEAINAQTVITVYHEKTNTIYPVDYDTFTFTPEQTGEYTIYYQAKMGIFGQETSRGELAKVTKVTDKQSATVKMTYAYTTDTNAQSKSHGLVNGIYSATSGTTKNDLDGRYLEPVTYDITDAGVVKSVTYKGETHNIDYTYDATNTNITHVNGIKFGNEEVFKLLMNRAVQDIVDGFFDSLDPEVASVAQLKKDGSGKSSATIVIPAIYGVDNNKLFNGMTYTRRLKSPSGQTLKLVKVADDPSTTTTNEEVLYADNETATYTITTAGEYEIQYTIYDGANTKTITHSIMVYDTDSDEDLKDYSLKNPAGGADITGQFGKLGDGVTTINSNISTKSVSSDGKLTFRKPTASDKYDENLDVRTYLNVEYSDATGTKIEVVEGDYVTYDSKSGEYTIDVAKYLTAAATADSKTTEAVKSIRVTVEAKADSTLSGTRISGMYSNGQVAVFDNSNSYTYYTKEITVRNTNDSEAVTFDDSANFNTQLISLNTDIVNQAMTDNKITGATTLGDNGFYTANPTYAPFNQNSSTDISLPTMTLSDNDANLKIKVLVSNTNDITGNVSNLSLENQYNIKVSETTPGKYTYTLEGATVNLAYSGVYTITYIAEDVGGNITVQSYGFRVNDKTKPTIMIADATEYDEEWEAGKFFTVPEATLQKYGSLYEGEDWALVWTVQPATPDLEYELEVDNGFRPMEAGTYYVNYYASNGTEVIELEGVYSLSVKDNTKPVITIDDTYEMPTTREWTGSKQVVYFPVATAVDPNFDGELEVTYTVTNANNSKVTNNAVDGDYIEYTDYYKITNNAINVAGKVVTLDASSKKYTKTWTTTIDDATKKDAYVENPAADNEKTIVKTKTVEGATVEYYMNGSTEVTLDGSETKYYEVFTLDNVNGEYSDYTEFEQITKVKDSEDYTLVDNHGNVQTINPSDYVRYVKVKDNTYVEAIYVRSFEAEKQSTYSIVYSATDGTNSATITKDVKVGDVTKPKLTWTDTSRKISTINKGETWTLPTHYITLSDDVSDSDYLWDKMTVTLTAPDSTKVTNMLDEDNHEYKWKFDQTGDYTVQITIRDEAGNVNSSETFKINVPADKAEDKTISPVIGTILIVATVLLFAGVVTFFVVSNLKKGNKKSKKKETKSETKTEE